jgi:hypothetical protein
VVGFFAIATGFHPSPVRIANRTDDELWLEYEIDGGSGGGGGELVPPGISERVISIPARSIGVALHQARGRNSLGLRSERGR